MTQPLLPAADADDFLQAIGRGSRRDSYGLTRCQIVSSTHQRDQARLHALNAGLKILDANGSPTVTVVQNAVGAARDQLEREILGQMSEQEIASRFRQSRMDQLQRRPQGIRAG